MARHVIETMEGAFESAMVRGFEPLVEQQAAANRSSPFTLFEILDALSTAGAPRFADEIRRRI